MSLLSPARRVAWRRGGRFHVRRRPTVLTVAEHHPLSAAHEVLTGVGATRWQARAPSNAPSLSASHSLPGFTRLRMLTKGGSPVSFVEYQDTNHAAVAMAMLQGFVLSPERGGVRIEYAKTKMADSGKRSSKRFRHWSCRAAKSSVSVCSSVSQKCSHRH